MGVIPKYQFVLDTLEGEISTGKYRMGQKIPSEMALVRRFKTSRITVGRAMQELVQARLVERRAGSGTFVCQTQIKGWSLGLLAAELGYTEMFEPICRGMAETLEAKTGELLWDRSIPGFSSLQGQTWERCQQYIDRRVAGVFFAPLELPLASGDANHRVIEACEKARIAIVLLDRDIVPHPERSKYDLVGIDNRRAGYAITEHLLKLGRKRVSFVAHPKSAPTIQERIIGYRQALSDYTGRAKGDLIKLIEPADTDKVAEVVDKLGPDACVCANDQIAAKLMHTLINLGHCIPDDIAIVGFDDVKYSSLLPVPLTTIRQPCLEIGEVAMTTMLQRLAKPELPARHIALGFKMVVRRSCGSPESERSAESALSTLGHPGQEAVA